MKFLHTQPRENSKDVLKIQLGHKKEKVDILRHKSNLKDKGAFRNIYIRSSKTHTDRIMDYNFKMLITELIPNNASEYTIAGNGKLIKKTLPVNTHQPTTGEKNPGDNQNHGSKPSATPTS